MKKLFREVVSILLIVSLSCTAVFLPAVNTADAGILSAVPGPGTYNRHQDVYLFNETPDESGIRYSVSRRATEPNIVYNPVSPVRIDEDVILSVNSTVGTKVTHREFSYIINPFILSTHIVDGTANISANPRLIINFSRKMDRALLETKSNIVISKISPTPVVDLSPADYTATYNPGAYRLEIDMAPGVTLARGATYLVTLRNIRDTNGKSLQGNSSFTFTTVASGDLLTYGYVRTDRPSYGASHTVSLNGGYFQGGIEVNGAVNLQLQVFNPSDVLTSTLSVTSVTYGSFNTGFSLPANAQAGAWTVRFYDGSTPRQLMNTATFTVVESTVSAPTANRDGGTYFEPVSLTLSSTTPGAAIYYVVDYTSDTSAVTVPVSIPDSGVDSSCTLYTGPISISAPGSTRVRAVAIRGGVRSALFDRTYTIKAELGFLSLKPTGTGVSLNTSVTVAFGRAVKSASINSQTFRLRESGGTAHVVGQTSYNAEKRTATFKPAGTLKPNTSYTVILDGYSGGLDNIFIEDLNGVRLAGDITWTFTTGADWIAVDGRQVSGNYIAVNKNPVAVVVTSPDTAMVTLNKAQMAAMGTNQFTGQVTLKPGNNTIAIEITDNSSVKNTVNVTVNYLNLLQAGAGVTAAIPAKGKLEIFDKQLAMDFPKGSYLKDLAGIPLEDQSIVFNVYKSAMLDGFPAVSHIFDIRPRTSGALLNNSGEAKITLSYDKYVSATSTPSLTVICDSNLDGVWEENLGGRVDPKKRTITVPFGYFGQYAVVNKVWFFSDYSTAGWARPYVEYLWAKGYMNPLPAAGPGRFGLVDAQGNEVPITRGEFAVMIGKILGLNKSSYTRYDIFTDMRLIENAVPPYAMARDLDGNWKSISEDDYKYIDMLARNGIINGNLDQFGRLVFNYHRHISREEVAVILAKAMNLTVETNDAKVSAAVKKMYTDANTGMGVWAQPYVLAVSKGYFGGFPDKTFRGKDNFTRPQAARVLYQAMQKAKLM